MAIDLRKESSGPVEIHIEMKWMGLSNVRHSLLGLFQIWQRHVSLHHRLIDRIIWRPICEAANQYTPKCMALVQRWIETETKEMHDINIDSNSNVESNERFVLLEKCDSATFQCAWEYVVEAADEVRAHTRANHHRYEHNNHLPGIRQYHRFDATLKANRQWNWIAGK